MKLNENQKVTLTLGQLKKLVKEAKSKKKDDAAVKKTLDFVAEKIKNALGVMGLEVGKTCEVRVNYDAHTIVVRTVTVKNMKRLQQALIKTANLVDDGVRKADAYWIARDKPLRMGRYDLFEIERV